MLVKAIYVHNKVAGLLAEVSVAFCMHSRVVRTREINSFWRSTSLANLTASADAMTPMACGLDCFFCRASRDWAELFFDLVRPLS